MSWRGRDEGRRWPEERRRSPVWEPRLSPERDRHRERDDRDRRERYDHERRRSRDRSHRDRDRDRDRERRDRRSPRRYDKEIPSAPSPPKISLGDMDSLASTRSGSGERDMDKHELDSINVTASPGDWVCKCGSFNFKRRQICYRRQCQGQRSDGTVYGGEASGGSVESPSGITKRLLFRRLDALTTEEKILEAIKERCSKPLLDSIAGITIGREALTGASKCLAYINFNSIAESSAAYQELLALEPRLDIDSREVVISYYNEPHKMQKQVSSNSADYSNYYAQMANYSATTKAALSEADRVNAAAAVAQSAISAAQARHMSWTPVTMPVFAGQAAVAAGSVPTGDGKTVYTAPDVRTFLYDESSGYYYDPATGLYYDGKTQYFFNNQTNQYMYWEGTSCTYIAVTQNQQAEASNQSKTEPVPPVVKEPEEKKKKDKEDKVKVAKKIAKDMERWARTLNQKKETAKNNYVMEQPLDNAASKGSADIGFSVLGAGPSIPATMHVRDISPPPAADDFLVKKNPEVPNDSDENIIDWSKLTCLLCKRRFPSIDVLTKHKTMSDLHKQNLAEFYRKNDLLPHSNGYRDRAAERRLKFGEDEPIINRKRYEMPDIASQPMSAPPPSVVDTIGGKMLQKMGWSEGRGLGKSEQGRIAPIEAEQRPGLAGLGQKRGIYTPTPGMTYRDTVKKLMIARYKEVVGQEDGD